MVISDEVMGILLVVALAGVVVLSVLVVLLLVRMARLRRAYAAAVDPDRREDLFQAVERQSRGLEDLRADVTTVHGNTERLREMLAGTLSRVGVVRYDAFDDMGGALSFSTALLDEHGDGLVVSAINGRSETRCYAKPVQGGESEYNLSAEETDAIAAARASGDGSASDPDRPRRGSRRRRVAS